VAVTPATGWEASASAFPTNLPPGGNGTIQVDIINTGATPSTGSITVTDTLPEGVTATAAGGMFATGHEILSSEEEEKSEQFPNSSGEFGARWSCSGATVVTCTSNPAFLPSLPVGAGNLAEIAERVGIVVEVDPKAPEREHADCTAEPAVCNRVMIAGGGAPTPAIAANPVTVSSSQPGFGFSGWDVWFTNADGTPDTQAGSHPYDATFALGFNELAHGHPPLAGGEVRNLEVDLPPGLFGDPTAVPRCTRAQLGGGECPAQAQVGVAGIGLANVGGGGTDLLQQVSVFNMIPPPGVPAEFGIAAAGFHALLDAGVRSGAGYGLVEHVNNISRVELDKSIITLWGVPAEASHDFQRNAASNGKEECASGCPVGIIPKPFLTLPTSCAGPQAFTVRGLATYTDPNARTEATVVTHDSNDNPSGFAGCERLSIEPSLSAIPDTGFADTPTGLTVDVKVPQETLTLPNALVASTIKNTTVTLPGGVVINPGQAAGLQACQAPEANVHGEGPQSCPAASKVGTVKVKSPLLEGTLESELEGNVYVLQSNPPNLQLLLAFSADGLYFKLVANVHLNETTGQLTTTLSETPELPFTDFKLLFSGGAQAALATPTGCGTYTTASDFTPWTSPFGEDVLSSSGFQIVGGPGGGACPSSPLPFGPSLIAGATTDQAGGFTNFSLLLQNGDGQQRIEKLQFKAPPGLSGMISQVPLCQEPQAGQGTCSASSQIGHAVVASGPGPYPLVIPEPGQPPAPIYLTGPYKGAPFGLSIVTPVIAGPFNLGTVITRARVEVDPHTAQITVTTDPLPQIIDGVPTDLRTINSVIDRPGFIFNPTNCDPSSFSGTAWGTPPPGAGGPGTTASISSHFQVGSCRGLEFAPKFSVSTSGKTSKANGASLTAKVSYPNAPQGTQADIGSVKVELPKQLPSRLTTLQKACTDAQFEANPAGCPSASFIGHAVVHTPVLPVPLEGPAVFVSHGGEAFPSLTVVLQGDGVTVDLVGATFINKAGVTSTTFKTVPDAPFSTFELTLPQGPFSALAANGDLCASTRTVTVKKKVTVKVRGRKRRVTRRVREALPGSLQMPNEFVAQNGAVLKQTTKIEVTGCATHKQVKKTKKKAGHKHRGKGKKGR
jgi:hypothetical protein